MICLQGDNFGLLAVPKQHASASGPSHLLLSARNALSPQYRQDLQLYLLSEVSLSYSLFSFSSLFSSLSLITI